MVVAQLRWTPALWANVLGALFLTTSWNCYASGGRVGASNAIFSVEQCEFYPINELHWTLSTLLFSWLMYPLLRPMLAGTYFGTRGKLLVSAAVLLLSQLPALFTWWSGAAASEPRFNLLYRWPPCQLLNFVFGMSVGQLARDEVVLTWQAWPWLVDLATATLCLTLLLSPLYQPILPGWMREQRRAQRCDSPRQLRGAKGCGAVQLQHLPYAGLHCEALPHTAKCIRWLLCLYLGLLEWGESSHVPRGTLGSFRQLVVEYLRCSPDWVGQDVVQVRASR
jgi:hypothetical protein